MVNRIPQEIIEEVMQRADIVEIVGEYVALRRRGRNYFGLCPFHHEDTPSFSVNGEKQIYKCFGCGKGGNVIGFVQEIEHLSFQEAVRKLAERYHIVIPERAMNPAEQARLAERQAMLAAYHAAAAFYAAQLPLSTAAQAYMQKRGIDSQAATRFGLGCAPEEDWQALYHTLREAGYGEQTLIDCGLISRSGKNGRCYDKFHGRLIFPIRDQRGGVVAFGGRAMRGEEPKYLNSQTTPIYNKSNVLYALDLAGDAIRRSGQVVIMEGYMDVLTAHRHGVENAVATCGTAFTAEHARLLRRYAPEAPERLQVLLAFDPDAAGARAAVATLEKLMPFDFIDARVLVFPEELDPDDFLRRYGQRGWQRVCERYCYPALDYLLYRALEKREIKSAADKAAVVAELLPALRRVRSSTERDGFIRSLAQRLQVSEDAIRTDLAGTRPAAAPPRQYEEQPVSRQREYRFSAGRPANRQLLLLALNDKNIFCQARQILGDDFASTEEEAQLIAFIEKLGTDYDFHPSSLFNHIGKDEEGLRQFLLKLLQAEPAAGDPAVLADAYIREIRRHVLTGRIEALRSQLTQAERNYEDTQNLLQEITRLTLESKQL